MPARLQFVTRQAFIFILQDVYKSIFYLFCNCLTVFFVDGGFRVTRKAVTFLFSYTTPASTPRDRNAWRQTENSGLYHVGCRIRGNKKVELIPLNDV